MGRQHNNGNGALGTSALDQLGQKLTEACYELWDNAVDPEEAFLGSDGELWIPVGDQPGGSRAAQAGITNEQQLAEVRRQCRALAAGNEFAINGHENRINYIVGPGHSYRASVKKGFQATENLRAEVQEVIDQFIKTNQWHRRQQEIVRRRDRDGEVFLRFFVDPDGTTRVRFVEPGQISTPADLGNEPSASFGIQTDRDDVETALGYYIDGEWVSADVIQHRKANVDSNVKRGLPLFYPVRKNLRRAEKLLRNMSVLAEIQSAIALIRKHRGTSRSGVEQFVSDGADTSVTSATTGKTSNFRRYGPGTILDAHGGVEYEFPAAGLNVASFVDVLKAELRAIASRLVMPEFMLTSDASNSNFASTMVAEGPAVKMFTRLQAELIEADREVFRRVIDGAVEAGKLSEAAQSQIEIHVEPPSLAVRDQLKDAQAYSIELEKGILSPQTWSQLRSLDYDQEQHNFLEHTKRANVE